MVRISQFTVYSNHSATRSDGKTTVACSRPELFVAMPGLDCVVKTLCFQIFNTSCVYYCVHVCVWGNMKKALVLCVCVCVCALSQQGFVMGKYPSTCAGMQCYIHCTITVLSKQLSAVALISFQWSSLSSFPSTVSLLAVQAFRFRSSSVKSNHCAFTSSLSHEHFDYGNSEAGECYTALMRPN